MSIARLVFALKSNDLNVWRNRRIQTTRPILKSHDVLAPFRPPTRSPNLVPTFPTNIAEITPDKRDGTFTTSSTQPAGISFQEIPPPDTEASKSQGHLATPVPAMKDVRSHAGRGDASQRRGEMSVQRVVVPPKPIPPGEEGARFP